LIQLFICSHSAATSELDQFGDTILFTTDDEILEAMSRYDETFLGDAEGPEGLVAEEELQRPRTANGEGEERPFTQAGFREADLKVSTWLISTGGSCVCLISICDPKHSIHQFSSIKLKFIVQELNSICKDGNRHQE